MRPAEVTNTEIVAAGRRLLAEGKKVNGWSLRAAVGNRGKPERLAEIWGRAEADGTPQPVSQPEPTVLPPGVAEMADEARGALVAQFDGILLRVVRQTEMELQARYKTDFDRLTTERADMSEQLATASASVGETEQALADALADADALRARLAEAETSAAVRADRLAVAETRAKETEARLVALEQQVRAADQAAQEARTSQAAAAATAAAAEREAGRLRQRVETLEGDLAAGRTEIATLAAATADLKAALAVQGDRADRTEAALERARQEREAADLAARQAAERAGAAEQRAAEAEARAAAKRPGKTERTD